MLKSYLFKFKFKINKIKIFIKFKKIHLKFHFKFYTKNDTANNFIIDFDKDIITKFYSIINPSK